MTLESNTRVPPVDGASSARSSRCLPGETPPSSSDPPALRLYCCTCYILVILVIIVVPESERDRLRGEKVDIVVGPSRGPARERERDVPRVCGTARAWGRRGGGSGLGSARVPCSLRAPREETVVGGVSRTTGASSIEVAGESVRGCVRASACVGACVRAWGGMHNCMHELVPAGGVLHTTSASSISVAGDSSVVVAESGGSNRQAGLCSARSSPSLNLVPITVSFVPPGMCCPARCDT